MTVAGAALLGALATGVSACGNSVPTTVPRPLPISLNYSPFLSSAQKSILSRLVLTPDGLGTHQWSQLSARFVLLGPAGEEHFGALLAHVGSLNETPYLWKALASGNSVSAIATFAGQIRGKSASWLAANLTVVDADLGPGAARLNGPTGGSDQLTQQWNDSCASTTAEAVEAFANPLYALWLHQGGPIDHQEWTIRTTRKEPNPRLSADQAAILISHGGTPGLGSTIDRGTPNVGYVVSVDQLAAHTGVVYDYTSVNPSSQSSLTNAVSQLLAGLDDGVPVPLAVGSSTTQEHAVMALRRSGNNILLFDPGYGQTGWITVQQIMTSHLSQFANGSPGGAGGWTSLWGVLNPVILTP